MRKFKTTPQKKFAGMIILFVGIPLFLLAYIFLVLKWRPGFDTVIIFAAIAILAIYFYLQYKKQLALQGKDKAPTAEEPVAEEPVAEEPLGELPEEDEISEEELIEEDKVFDEEPLPKEKPSKKK